MYEMLTGKHPFSTKAQSFGNWYQAHRFQPPPPFEEMIPQVKIPSELKKLVMNCLAKEISARPNDISQILETLEKIQRIINNDIDKDKSSKYASPVQLVPITSLSEKACLEKTWPKNKPIGHICFPHLLHTQYGSIPTFWAMLPKKEITKFLNEINGTEFIYSQDLHPLLLWVTALCDSKFGLTRWLSYFLDLKDSKGQKIVQLLADTGYYHLLFFALEEPSVCAHVLTLNISASQRENLIDCLNNNQKLNSTFSQENKQKLKSKYEKMKPEIIQSLVVHRKQKKTTVKKWIFKLFDKFLNCLVWN
ncbi:hypothetical protein NUACC21_02120 [Scytonema sp. NUACC21]